ncbi:hypothetical protein CRE_04817 [Caenorhabditis remanei]|uniref:Uncharacterized protein n=1 Tax=Caenorhabditis remanei TaxID=31234 RepID=E3LZE0_CAERE|nr:hypothetical protein CRE_04817 [Caenorhabditis remanei]
MFMRLENNRKYDSKTTARCKRSDDQLNRSVKSKKMSAKSSKKSKKSKKEMTKSKKSDRSKSSKKEKMEKSDRKLDKKKSSIREKVEEPKSQKEEEEFVNEEKPKPFQKVKRPWKNLFKLKRKRARKDVHVSERNGTWCHLFAMGHDIHATTVFFRRVSVRMGLLTGTVICLVFYICTVFRDSHIRYFRKIPDLRRLLTNEKLVHQAELFRHNWCLEVEDKEERLDILERNRLFDTSLLDSNIDEPGTIRAVSQNTTRSEDAEGETEELLGLLPRDKLASFPYPVKMKFQLYLLLIFIFPVIWLILLFELTLHTTGHNTRHLFSEDNFGFAWMYEVLRAHRELMNVKEERHKCMGTMKEMKSGLSSSVMTIMKVFVWERSLGSSIIPIVISIISLGILLDLALQGLFSCRLNHREVNNDGKRYIFFYNVAIKFFISFFVFSIFLAITLMTEKYFFKPDRRDN